jgi:transposase
MDRHELETLLVQGMSLEAIGRRYGKDHSTVGYWVKKHGLRAAHRERFAPRGGLDREHLETLVGRGLTTQQIAEATSRSCSTVRYWLERFGLKTARAREPYPADRPERAERRCHLHGFTEFILEKRGYYRCIRCRAERVAERRRKVKAILVEEAGGRCVVCGYDRHVGALQFHHIDPSAKAFALSRAGWTRSLVSARREAEKCALVCANCHAEIEGGVANLPRRQEE